MASHPPRPVLCRRGPRVAVAAPSARLPLLAGAGMVALLASLATGHVSAQTADAGIPQLAGEAAPRLGSRGAAILLDQANYWSAQGRPQLAQQALDRLLTLEPNNPGVLAAATEVAALNGDRTNAELYTARLNQIAPGTPAALRAATSLRALLVDQTVLAEARRLSLAGQREAAMQRYRELFPQGEVPLIFASEYYQTLAGTSPENFEEARRGMEAAVMAAGENRPLQLAYAQMLTYNESYRLQGIERLRQLVDIPAISSAVRSAWRQAILWMPGDPDAAEAIGIYLQSNPPDPEIEAKYNEAKGTLVPQWVTERLAGWDAIAAGRVNDAERNFNTAREGDPTDPEAVIGLAIVRKLQFRFPEARTLFEEGIALAPFRREEFTERVGSLDGYSSAAAAGNGRGNGRGRDRNGNRGAGAVAPSSAVQAWRSLNRNEANKAEEAAQRALRGNANERLQGELVLGFLAIRRDDFSTAETRFRTALTIQRTNTAAQGGLYEALQRQGRFGEADQLLAENGFRPPAGSLAFRSAALRQEAQRTTNPDAKIVLLRNALAADPSSTWAAFDLARSLKGKGQADEARRLERELAARNAPDALFASALLSNADGRIAETVARLGAIPPSARTEDGSRLLEQNRRALELRQLEAAARGNPRSDAARRLLALASQPDATGETQASVIRAFARLRQPANIEAAARAASPVPSTPATARIAIAGALLDAGRAAEAEAAVANLDRDSALASEARSRATTVRAISSATSTDRLNDSGDRQGVLNRLAPSTGQASSNIDVQLSLARVYSGSGRGIEAVRIAEPILEANPDYVRARAVAGEAAVASNSIGRAEQILREGRARGADELQMALLEARIARARDDNSRARRALEEAARLRAMQLREGN